MHYRMQKIQAKCRDIRWWNFGLAYILIINLMVGLLPKLPAHAEGTCADVEFIYARGSGEAIVEPTYRAGDRSSGYAAWRTEIEDSLSASSLDYQFYELGTKSYDGNKYEAVSISDNFWGFVNLAGAAISSGTAFKFGHSVRSGMKELELHIEEVNAECSETKFVLTGYSQGAMVVIQGLNELNAGQIVFAATVGDPKLFLPEGDAGSGFLRHTPDACRGVGLSDYRMIVTDCYAHEGVFGGLNPYRDSEYKGKVGTWCNDKDIICSSGMSMNDHTSYVSKNYYSDIARTIRKKLKETFGDKVVIPQSATHDLMLLFDATGSMKDTVAKYEAEAKKLAEKVIMSGGRVSMYAYREWNGHNTTIEYCAFGCSLEELERKIYILDTHGGGDEDEGLLAGLDHAMRRVEWTPGATKSVVALTDAGFHDPDHGNLTIASIVDLSLMIDPVNIYVIAPSTLKEDQIAKYKQLTSLTGGRLFDVDNTEEIELSTKVIYQRPVAILGAQSYAGLVNEEIMFDASDSYSVYGKNLTFDWDLNGDGKFEQIGASAQITHRYESAGEKTIQVRVNDEYGSSTMSAPVKIMDTLPRDSEIQGINTEILPDKSAKVSFTSNGEKVLLALNDGPTGFIDVVDGQGEFTLQEITEDVTVTLVPYLDEHRGQGASIGIAKQSNGAPGDDEGGSEDPENENKNAGEDSANGEDNKTPAGTEEKDDNDGNINHGQPSSSSDVTKPIDVTVPKAPDTGTYDPRLARLIKNN